MNGLLIPLAACLGVASLSLEEGAWSVLALESPEERVALRDVDGDGDEDVVLAGPEGLAVLCMEGDGHYPSKAGARLDWASNQVAWNVADLDGDGACEVLLFVDGRRIVRHVLRDGGFAEAEPVLEVRGDMPRGIYFMDFCRDVDGDGRLDLVLPALGHYAVFLRRGEGFAEPIEIAMRVEVDADFGRPERLGERFGQEVDIPWFSLEDLDGDGRRDLRATTQERVYFHLATPELHGEADWVLDLEALERELPPDRGVDLDDLLSVAGRQVAWRLAELAPGRPKDLLVQVGSKFRIYHGGSRTGPEGAPDQLLKSSGNVLFFFLRDVTGDGELDLQLLRSEGLSIGRVIRWLVLPGSLDFQLYTYTNTEGEFSTRPTRRNTISLEIPRILSFLEKMEKLEEERENEEEVFARLIDLDGDGENDDIVDCREARLYFYRNPSVPETARRLSELERGEDLTEMLEYFLLDDLDRRGDGGTRSVDLEETETWIASAADALREASLRLEPVSVVAVPASMKPSSLHVRDVNGDGVPDVLLVGRELETDGGPARRLVQVFVR